MSLCFLVAAPAAQAATPEDLSELGRVWAEQTGFSGSVRVQQRGQLLPAINQGTADPNGKPIDDETVFWIGSLSKQFAAVAALLLAERGQLEPSAPLTRYLPELDRAVLTKGGLACSVEHVLSHTCGLPREIGFDLLYTARHLSEPERARRLFERVNGSALRFVPGAGYQYSNVGYDLMGLVVQRAAGRPYERFLQEELWQPLGMTRTGIQLRSGMEPLRGQISAGFAWLTAATWLFFDPHGPADMGASGNVYSTPTDLLRWNHALHHGQILEPASYQSMIRPRSEGYGLGIAISQKVFGTALHHLGSHAPQSTSGILVYAPDHDIGLAGLANRSIAVSGLKELADGLLTEAAGFPGSPPGRPGLLIRIMDSALLLAMLVVLATAAVTLWHCYRRHGDFNRAKWWLSYHTAALMLGTFMLRWLETAAHPAFLVWGAAMLVGSYGGHWWTLPQRSSGSRPLGVYVDLAARAAVLLALYYFSTWPTRSVFSVVCAVEVLGIGWLWLRQRSVATKHRATADS
jgi:CubicO group peptidase (beta-lactamase class C family)